MWHCVSNKPVTAMMRLGPIRPMGCWISRYRCRRELSCMASTEKSTNYKILVSHVLVKDSSKAQVLFDDLERQLASGSAFPELAKKHSECAQSSQRGGQLGWLQRGTYFPEFEAAAFGAAGISAGSIVRAQTSIGCHLIRVDDVREVTPVQQLDPSDLLEVLGNPALSEDVQFIDVREEWEFQTAKLPLFKLFPLSQFQDLRASLEEDLDASKETVILCHHGVRSMQMANYLVSELGFKDVKNVTGGIDAYSLRVDTSVPRY